MAEANRLHAGQSAHRLSRFRQDDVAAASAGDPALAGTAVLINEFGEVGLDHHLVERIDETVVLLRSGCLCCTIRGELATAIRDLHSRRDRGELPAFRRLVIESTGLADPFPILSTLKADPVLRHHFRAGALSRQSTR